MEKRIFGKINGSVPEFIALLKEFNAISLISEKLINLLVSMDKNLSEPAIKVLITYFSLLDDGNTRIALDLELLMQKWESKWNGLLIQELSLMDSNNEPNKHLDISLFRAVFQQGIEYLLYSKKSNIIGDSHRPLIIQKDKSGISYLYANKYYEAKSIIETNISRIFQNKASLEKSVTREEVNLLSKGFEIEDEQLDAINRGQSESLIITGGPGTGKTTVVLYILWFLLKNQPEYLSSEIFLSAPSGKAADRMSESISNSLKHLNYSKEDEISEQVFRKLKALEGSTIHRLLKYNPLTNQFIYNKDKTFPAKSIFVIDEASMIDISLFASFLQALPADARVFILGDIDQLPSVDAGAVLGDLLNAKDSITPVRLTVSRRFNKDSLIGKLARKIQEAKKTEVYSVSAQDFQEFNCFVDAEKEDISSIIDKWVAKEYFIGNESICDLAMKVNPLDDRPKEEEIENRKRLWAMNLKCRILAAENKGIRGIKEINKLVLASLLHRCQGVKQINKNFAGQLLIITKNQNIYKLYNGDTGIVVFGGSRPYLMLQKKSEHSDLNGEISDFVFYPLSVLAQDAMESAFAITIHRSQGSEYEDVLMFIPKQIGHPILNNQILYTGVTRVKKNITIISNPETLAAACKNIITRDTGISL